MQAASTKTPGRGAWTPRSPSTHRSPTPLSISAPESSTTSHRPCAATAKVASAFDTAGIRTIPPRPAAPFPLLPLEEILGFRIPTPSPEPEIVERPTRSDLKRRRTASGRPPLPRSHPNGSDEPVLQSTPPLHHLLSFALPSFPTSYVDPSKITFDPQAQPAPLDAVCKVVRYPGKGFGLQATRDVQRGEEIIREKPFITFAHPITSIELHERWTYLPLREPSLFLSFTGTVKDEPDRWVNIAETNCIDTWNKDEDEDEEEGTQETEVIDLTDDDDSGPDTLQPGGRGRVGLFEYICRMNHSCCPNTGWSWDKEAGQLVLIASEPIHRGEEITASYKGDVLFLPQAARSAMLEKIFGFQCACTLCSLPPGLAMHSDAQLTRYRQIRDSWRDIRDFAFDRGKALSRLEEAEEILRLQGKAGRKGELLEHRFMVYAMWGQRQLAIEAGQCARGWAEIIDGKKLAGKRDLARFADHPEEYEGWEVALQDNGGVLVSDGSGAQYPFADLQSAEEDGRSDLVKSITAGPRGRSD